MKVTLRNDYHNTTATVLTANLPCTLSHTQYLRVRRSLCPYSDCTCGKVRGPQDYAVEPATDARGKLTYQITAPPEAKHSASATAQVLSL